MDRDPGDQRRASLRASDADREQFVEAVDFVIKLSTPDTTVPVASVPGTSVPA